MIYPKSLVVKETERTIDSRVQAINTAQRIRETREILETEEFTASKEYREMSRKTPTEVKFAHPLVRRRRL